MCIYQSYNKLSQMKEAIWVALTDDGLETKVLLFCLDLLELADELLELLKPVCDEACLLLQVHALINEASLMLQERV